MRIIGLMLLPLALASTVLIGQETQPIKFHGAYLGQPASDYIDCILSQSKGALQCYTPLLCQIAVAGNHGVSGVREREVAYLPLQRAAVQRRTTSKGSSETNLFYNFHEASVSPSRVAECAIRSFKNGKNTISPRTLRKLTILLNNPRNAAREARWAQNGEPACRASAPVRHHQEDRRVQN
jgi:hypothetical protein